GNAGGRQRGGLPAQRAQQWDQRRGPRRRRRAGLELFRSGNHPARNETRGGGATAGNPKYQTSKSQRTCKSQMNFFGPEFFWNLELWDLGFFGTHFAE